MSASPSGAEAQAALADAAAQGIHCLTIPTPFAIGRVNVYLIEDEPLTLIDSGPNWAKSLDELERALAARGHRIEDLELLVITHQHMDHLGLTGLLARRSGAEVAAIDLLVRYFERYDEDADRDDAFAQELMHRHGVPDDVAAALRAMSSVYRSWGAGGKITRPLADGAELALRDRTLRVLHRPGHSPSDTVFWDERQRLLIAGDHLIRHVSSNPLISLPLDHERVPGEPRPKTLMTYMDSLRATREMPLDVVLAGHGEPVLNHAALIDERFRMHARRAEKIHGLIAGQPRSAYEIAHALWGNVAVTQAFLTLSEVLGHVDLLLADGRAVEREQDGVVRFEAVAE